jgi:dehydrogenase/reductase SDR family member 7B
MRRLEGTTSNLVVWITGASSGIGEALTYAYSRKNARLIISSRRECELLRVKMACGSNAQVSILPMDLEQLADVRDKGTEALSRFGYIDILVNNAGISQRSQATETSLEVDERIMRIDYLGQVAATKSVLPSMIARKCGHIVVISSIAGLTGVPLYSAYCGAKHALRGFFTALRAELRAEGIKVSIVYPTNVKTNISVNALQGDGSSLGIMSERHRRGMTADECATQILAGVAVGKEEIFTGRAAWTVVQPKPASYESDERDTFEHDGRQP